jgi:hypothetical protein
METSPVIADERTEQWDVGWERITREKVKSADVKGSCPVQRRFVSRRIIFGRDRDAH